MNDIFDEAEVISSFGEGFEQGVLSIADGYIAQMEISLIARDTNRLTGLCPEVVAVLRNKLKKLHCQAMHNVQQAYDGNSCTFTCHHLLNGSTTTVTFFREDIKKILDDNPELLSKQLLWEMSCRTP